MCPFTKLSYVAISGSVPIWGLLHKTFYRTNLELVELMTKVFFPVVKSMKFTNLSLKFLPEFPC